jgi:hypothetical protein
MESDEKELIKAVEVNTVLYKTHTDVSFVISLDHGFKVDRNTVDRTVEKTIVILADMLEQCLLFTSYSDYEIDVIMKAFKYNRAGEIRLSVLKNSLSDKEPFIVSLNFRINKESNKITAIRVLD